MTIRFKCPGCNFQFNVDPSLAGTRARCNTCGTVLQVPRADQQAPIDLAKLPLTSLENARTTALFADTHSNSDQVRRTIVIGALGGAALLAVIGVVAFAMSTGKKDAVADAQNGPLNPAPINNNSDLTTNNAASNGPANPPVNNRASSTFNNNRPANQNAAPGMLGNTNNNRNQPDANNGNSADNPFVEVPAAAGGTSNNQPDTSGNDNPFEELADENSNPFQEMNSGESDDENPFVETDELTASSAGSSGTNSDPKGPSLQAGAWAAAPDPPLEPIVAKEGRFSLGLPGNSDVLFPMQASHFVLVGAGSHDDLDYAAFDLTTGTLFGQQILDGIELNAPRIMSADGKYLAGIHGRGDEAKIEVWSFETAARVCELSAPLDGDVFLFFAAPGELGLIRNHIFDGLSVRLWNIASQKQLWKKDELVAKDQMRGASSFVVSHTGKYAVLLTGDRLRVFDLKNGEAVGVSTLAETPSRCYGLAFSPDGKELAALNQISSGAQLVIWDFSSGQILLNHPYYEPLEHIDYNGPALEWVPDKSGLLVAGHILVDRETGEEIWNLPTSNASPRRMMKADQVLVFTPDDKGRKMSLTGVMLPVQEIAKVRDTVRGGGEAIDSLLPPLSRPDLGSAKDLEVPSTTAAWKFQADPAPPALTGVKTIPITEDKGRIQQIRFAAANVSKVLVTREVEKEFKAGRRAPRQYVLNNLDLLTGRSSDAMPLLPQYELLDASPDGSLALVGLKRKEAGYDRLDILSLSPKKHVAGFRPYSLEATKDHQTVQWAFMSANDRVVTCNSFGRLIVWSLPGCRAEYILDGIGEPLCISPTRRYLVAYQNPSIRIYDVQNGECRGDCELLPAGTQIVRASIRPDAGELIALVEGLQNKMIYRWSLSDGKIAGSFPIPDGIVQPIHFVRVTKSAAGLFWVDNRYVLLDGVYLLDVENQSVVWKYHLFPSNFIDLVGGKVWLAGGEDGGPFSKQVLAPLSLPSSNTRETAKFRQLEHQLALGPNSKVRVQVQLHGQFSRHNPAVQAAMAQRLKQFGMQADDSAPLTLVISSGERSTGEILAVESGPAFGFGGSPGFGGSSSNQTFSQQAIYLQFSIVDAAGAGVWKNEMMIPMRAGGGVRSDNAQGASAELRSEMESSFEHAISQGNLPAMLPPYVFKPLDQILAGQSTISLKGEGAPPQPAQPNNSQPTFGAPTSSPFGGGLPGPFGGGIPSPFGFPF